MNTRVSVFFGNIARVFAAILLQVPAKA